MPITCLPNSVHHLIHTSAMRTLECFSTCNSCIACRSDCFCSAMLESSSTTGLISGTKTTILPVISNLKEQDKKKNYSVLVVYNSVSISISYNYYVIASYWIIAHTLCVNLCTCTAICSLSEQVLCTVEQFAYNSRHQLAQGFTPGKYKGIWMFLFVPG